jgi:type IV pilus assembly protein PilQ
MRRSFLLLSALIMLFMVAFVAPLYAAESLSVVSVSEKKVELAATMGIEQVKYFTLDSPKRLVVDLYGVQPGNHNLNLQLSSGFEQLRTGPLSNKTRFVFDVSGAIFPTFNVNIGPTKAVVTWEQSQNAASMAISAPSTVGSAKITAIDFESVNNQSSLLLTLAGSADVTEVVREGNKVQFALKNTTLPRSLRREFDTLTFPSAIHSVTPYLVNSSGKPEVRFVILLKGSVPYSLQKNSTGYAFSVNDGQYSAAASVITGKMAIPAAGNISTDSEVLTSQTNEAFVSSLSTQTPVPVIERVGSQKSNYAGEKTSLVFDNADVRDILRLIAEISDLNIIASDAVKGNVTLRLIDVPWDQALDLILDVTGLGMVQEGNVVRVLPKEEIRSMREAELTAARSQEKLEPLATEVVTVSYADLKSVADPAKELLSDRGSLTEDSRNKLLIITDVQQRIDKAKQLISILDTPERQVMIEARIVQVNSNYSRDLGVHWGVFTAASEYGNGNSAIKTITSAGGNFIVDVTEGSVGPITTAAGLASQIQVGTINDMVLDLQLSALESNGKGKVISTPRVTTLNGETATISQGTTIPYQTSGADGPKTEFVNAELKLEVTPVINPDDSIILEILTTNDSPSLTSGATAPSIDTKKAETKVLITDGETTVIGGIFVENIQESEDGVPGLMNIPILGHLFKTQKKQTVKDELLIFITPRIVRRN